MSAPQPLPSAGTEPLPLCPPARPSGNTQVPIWCCWEAGPSQAEELLEREGHPDNASTRSTSDVEDDAFNLKPTVIKSNVVWK